MYFGLWSKYVVCMTSVVALKGASQPWCTRRVVPEIFAVFRPPKICTNTAISDSAIENESLIKALSFNFWVLNFLFCLVPRAQCTYTCHFFHRCHKYIIRPAGAAGFVSLTSCLCAVRPGNHCHQVKEIWSSCKFSGLTDCAKQG